MELSFGDINKISDNLTLDGNQFIVKYRSGKTRFQGGYAKRKLNGEIKAFYESGELGYVCNCKDNLLIGKEKTYYISGAVKAIRFFNEGKLSRDCKIFYESGKRQCFCQYQKGQLNGKYIVYYKSGGYKIFCRFLDNKRNGIFKEYYESGKIKAVRNYTNDILSGEETEYYESGRTKNVNRIYFLKKGKDKFEINKFNLWNNECLDKWIDSIYKAVENKRKTEYRVCEKCRIEKSIKEFVDKSLTSGLGKHCKSCKGLKTTSDAVNKGHKKCTKCGEVKPTSSFRFRKKRNYYESACKLCEQKGLTGRRRTIVKTTDATRKVPIDKKNSISDTLKQYIKDEKAIEISYKAKYGPRMNRTIKPLSLNGVLLRAYCYLRKDKRTFNITKMKIISEKQ